VDACDKTTLRFRAVLGSLTYYHLKIFMSKSCCSQSQRLEWEACVYVVVMKSAVKHVFADKKRWSWAKVRLLHWSLWDSSSKEYSNADQKKAAVHRSAKELSLSEV